MGKRSESFEAVQKSTVRIKDKDGKTYGTGFFVSREAHLLTCAHVVRDAGGWKNVRVMDQPVTCLYEGDPERDDFSLLQVEDAVVVAAEFGKDFDPGDEFLSFGFSNEEFYGAPIRGEITAFARCGALGDQKLIRLETFSDAQRIEGGQSGAPVFVYQQGKYKVIGLIVASEDLNGGLAIPSSTLIARSKILSKIRPLNIIKFALYSSGVLTLITLAMFWVKLFLQNSNFVFFLGKCSPYRVTELVSDIDSDTKDGNIDSALFKADQAIEECKDDSLIIAKSQILLQKKDYEQVINTVQKITSNSQSPHRVKAIYNLGIAYSNLNDCEKALQEFEKIQDNRELTIKVYYNMGGCFSDLQKWNEAILKLQYVAETAKKIAVNSRRERTGSFIYYQESVKLLADIYATLVYENQGTSKEGNYLDSFIQYYGEFLEETIEPNRKKAVLDNNNSYVLARNVNSSKIYTYIYQTKEFKILLCNLYKKNSYAVPENLKNICSQTSDTTSGLGLPLINHPFEARVYAIESEHEQ
ncbi:tetratricopeptide repeat-containing serine protease family protein [Microcoleus sp. S13C4]|uniref:tetratricopeptide repeat-containing serine protease family protein n=1 Tax=Microcoleus sp. S13C4 TaxID=3055410 RepID=UPI002FCEB460